jgi:hypothetical protein
MVFKVFFRIKCLINLSFGSFSGLNPKYQCCGSGMFIPDPGLKIFNYGSGSEVFIPYPQYKVTYIKI